MSRPKKKEETRRLDLVLLAVKYFFDHSKAPTELIVIVESLNSPEMKKVMWEHFGIDFNIRSEFLVATIERPGTGYVTRFDGERKLISLAKWGFGRTPILADKPIKRRVEARGKVLPMRRKTG